MTDDVVARARNWLSDDPDPVTRRELEDLIAAGDIDALTDRLSAELEFGTAGLRGALGGGSNRMNRKVVIRAAAGLAAHLDLIGASGPVVVGHDARHGSAMFAADTAEVVTGRSRPVLMLPPQSPTPLLAFAVGDQRCAAGVMVTASHNPASDNGYKVYGADGAQIIGPTDTQIAAQIRAVPALADIARGDRGVPVDSGLVERYVAVASAAAGDGPRDLTIAYTPMHGVGRGLLERVVAAAGFDSPYVVAAQADPDPDFPTVSFPNPEEPGAMDLLLALARERDADIAIANDPDADRLAVAVPDPETGWRALSGNEVGALLGDALLAGSSGSDRVVATSIVSSSLLAKLAEEHGATCVETLTGFKWLVRAAERIPGGRLIYAFEESLGYAVTSAVRDKDGISAAAAVLALAAAEKARGSSLLGRLGDIERRHGVHATAAINIRAPRQAISQAVDRLRAAPPTSIGTVPVSDWSDLSRPEGDLPPTEGVSYVLADGSRVVVRPSGTEPKLKAYVEVVLPAAERATSDARVSHLAAAVTSLIGLSP